MLVFGFSGVKISAQLWWSGFLVAQLFQTRLEAPSMDLLRASMANLNKSPSGLKSHPLFSCVEPLRISRLHTQSPKNTSDIFRSVWVIKSSTRLTRTNSPTTTRIPPGKNSSRCDTISFIFTHGMASVLCDEPRSCQKVWVVGYV